MCAADAEAGARKGSTEQWGGAGLGVRCIAITEMRVVWRAATGSVGVERFDGAVGGRSNSGRECRRCFRCKPFSVSVWGVAL